MQAPPIKRLIDLIKDSAKANSELTLSAEEVKILANMVKRVRFAPVFNMNEVDKILYYTEKMKKVAENDNG